MAVIGTVEKFISKVLVQMIVGARRTAGNDRVGPGCRGSRDPPDGRPMCPVVVGQLLIGPPSARFESVMAKDLCVSLLVLEETEAYYP